MCFMFVVHTVQAGGHTTHCEQMLLHWLFVARLVSPALISYISRSERSSFALMEYRLFSFIVKAILCKLYYRLIIPNKLFV